MLAQKYIDALIAAELETVRRVLKQEPSDSHIIEKADEAGVSMHWLPSWTQLPLPNDQPMFAHAHNFFELMYVEQGEFHNAVSDDELVLDRHNVAILTPGTYHRPYIRTDDDLVVNLMLSPAIVERAMLFLGTQQSAITRFFLNYIYGIPSSVHHLIIPRNAEIDALVEQIVQTYFDQDDLLPVRMRLLVAELLMALCQSYNALQPANPVPEGACLSDVICYMRANYSTVTLNELSNVFHYSTAHLSRMIKTGMGKSFRDIIADYKVESVCNLLRTTDFSVAHIAELLNIQDPGYLAKVVKAKTGMTPMHIRGKKD